MGVGLYTRLCSGLVFPLHERLKGHASVRLRRELEASQWWPRERIEAERVLRLRQFLQDVGRRVPYYRALFQAHGFDPGAVTSAADLQRLLLLDKAAIRSAGDSMKADGHGPLNRFNTGGSSGEPLVFHVGKHRISHDVAAKWRATRWWDVDIGDPEMVVWGSPIELGAQDRVRQVRDAVLRTQLLPAFEMTDAKLDGFLQAIRRTRPRILFGYPSALSHIARHAQARAVAMNDLGIRVAFVTSERLYDEQRRDIETTFGCRVANGYGGRDAGFIAHECPAGRMHLSAEHIIVEILDPQGRPVAEGQLGEIVTTHLATEEFPFIRYRTGDVAAIDTQPCPCGRGLPVLKDLQGRTTDFVVTADGAVMHGLALIYVLRDMSGLSAFKITQHSLQHTQVQVVPEAPFSDQAREHIVASFRRRLGANVQVDVDVVANIPPERSGKFRYVVSHVAQGAQAATSPRT